MSDSIRVVCRLRPLNKIEIANQGEQCVTYGQKQINICVGGQESKYTFAFDKIFGPNTQQVAVYKEVAIPVIKSVLSGFNGTIFAYGQTGGGKTWTMEGPNHHDSQFKGLIPRTIQGLFEGISESDQNLEFVIKSSYVEIYNEKLFDLLDPSKARLEIKEDKQKGVFIQNCTEISVSSSEQMLKTMDSGSQNRKVAFTGMNQRSSRSHSLFIIHVNQKNLKKDSTKQSKLYFVDLAGSQKVSKTNVQGQQLQQAKNINKSLSSLGNVINALTSDKKQHIPYRDSKLTRILQQSLGGNSKTTLIINCSMCTYNDKQTLSTLRFGYRAKSIKNKPKMNEEKSVKQLMILLDAANKTISQLRCQLNGGNPVDVQQRKEQINTQIQQKQMLIQDLKTQLQANRQQQKERSKEMQIRIKQLLMQLTSQKQQKQSIQKKWRNAFYSLSASLTTVMKMLRRTYMDMDYCMNDILLNGKIDNIDQSKETIVNTQTKITELENYYEQNIKQILDSIAKQDEIDGENYKGNMLTPDKRKTKFALSQPALYSQQQIKDQSQKYLGASDDGQLSCILQQQNLDKDSKQQNNSSDKISQSSLTQFETMLQSIQTKQSQKILIEEMASNMRDLKRENDQLSKKCEKMMQEKKVLGAQIQQKYQQIVMELQQRVHEYKNIMHQKDIELTKKFDEIEIFKKKITEQKIVSDRFKKIIQSNGNMKNIHDLQQRVRSLANERQKIFNEMYRLRQQLDESQISLKQKEEHVQSLKEVLKDMNQSMTVMASPQEIQKNYNTKVYGTQTPKVIQTVKGGGSNPQGSKQQKKSSLRRKTNSIIQKREESLKKDIKSKQSNMPFYKTFFN